jgi:hypothetical protein
MSETQTIELPKELISEKSFYTLAGASVCVFLLCWAVNYLGGDSFSYKFYRGLAMGLSVAFSILIMFQRKKRKGIQYLLAAINAILIFINATGANVVTAQSALFNERDTTSKSVWYGVPERKFTFAGLFPLPGMTPWFPDEELIEAHQQAVSENQVLVATNLKLMEDGSRSSSEREERLLGEIDSLKRLVEDYKQRLSGKEEAINQLNTNAKLTGNELQEKLSACLTDNNKKSDSLTLLAGRVQSLKDFIDKLQGQNGTLSNQLETCNSKKNELEQRVASLEGKVGEQQKQITALATKPLTEHLTEACQRKPIRYLPGHVFTKDELLLEQDFWKTFCGSYSAWTTVIK